MRYELTRGGGDHVNILNKEGGSLLFTLCGGGRGSSSKF